MKKAVGNYINGEWRTPDAVKANVNPSDLADTIGEYASSSAWDVDEAVSAAKAAFPKWSRSVPMERHVILKRIASLLADRAAELGEFISREEGKILSEGIGEANRAAQIFDFFAAETIRLAGDVVASVRPGVGIEVTREPMGTIGMITPWNVPLAIPAWKIAPALAYGNCVVLKPADLTPASAQMLAEIIAASGLPKGVFNLVLGRGGTVGQRLLEHPDIHAISFTGSVSTGRLVAATAVGSVKMKKVQLEMGGKNPLVVLDDADLDIAADVAVDGAYFSTGQRCTASSRLIVTEGIHDRFVDAVKQRMEKLVVGHALDPASRIGPVVDARQFEQNFRYIDKGKSEGAHLAFGGEQLVRPTKGFYMSPALFTEATPNLTISREEIFGPVAVVIRVKDYDEALHVANDTTYGLSSGICTTSLKYATDFKRNSESGVVSVNLPTAGADFHVPFGGRKGSSYGPREQGSYAREFYTQVKTAYTRA
ncbi:aldehyde dehydrogenase family protein [Ochrobactrum sp. A-1]|uniref:aldehyde dehydrogenase family protein n=1 Tax=Ochrobactrum sp. A-1 TaxID=2920940 RepID=UPI001F0A40D9|nr:aldehyde dehydrogenase family protein [Ochrobactrum sp. A-1]